MTTLYVDNTLHVADNAVGTATGGGNDYILLEDDGVQNDDDFNNYGIMITGGTGVGQHRRIIDYDHTGHGSGERYAQVNAAWAVNPDATSTYEITVGCDQNNGEAIGLYGGADGALATLGQLAATWAAADVCHVRAGRSYTHEDQNGGGADAVMQIQTAGTSTAPVVLAGFKTTPGDADAHWRDADYRFTIDASTEGLTNCINEDGVVADPLWLVVKHCRCTGATSAGIALSACSGVRLPNVRCDTNGAHGCELGSYAIVECGQYDVNTGYGILLPGSLGIVTGALIGDNAGIRQLSMAYGVVDGCVIYGVAAGGDGINCSSGAPLFVSNTLIDCEDAAGSQGIHVHNGRVRTRNVIFHRCPTTVDSNEDHGECECALNNMVSPSPASYENYATLLGEVVTDTPGFADDDAHDYSLSAVSPAKGAGFPAAIGDVEVSYDIGPCQRQEGPRVIGGPVEIGVHG